MNKLKASPSFSTSIERDDDEELRAIISATSSQSQRLKELQAQFFHARSRIDKLLQRTTWHYDIDNRRRSFVRTSSRGSFDMTRMMELGQFEPVEVKISATIKENENGEPQIEASIVEQN